MQKGRRKENLKEMAILGAWVQIKGSAHHLIFISLLCQHAYLPPSLAGTLCYTSKDIVTLCFAIIWERETLMDKVGKYFNVYFFFKKSLTTFLSLIIGQKKMQEVN